MSLAELLEKASHIKAKRGVCGAVWCLNADKRPAKAKQAVVFLRFCRSREFLWSGDDEAMICIVCLTPKRQCPPSESE